MSTMYITFEEYLRQQLSPVNKVKLEQQLASDSAKKQSFESYKLLRQQLQNKYCLTNEKQVLKQSLNKLGDQYFGQQQNLTETKTKTLGNTKTIPLYRKYIMSIAAGLAILMAVGFGLKQYANTSYSNAALADINSIAEVINENATRSGSDVNLVGNDLVQDALVSIQSNDLELALSQVSQIESSSAYYDQGLWIKAKILLSNNDILSAKAILFDLSSRENAFQNESKMLIEKLESTMYRIATF